MKKTLLTIIIAIIAVISIVSTVKAEVEGITAENYLDYEKPIKDEYGFNKGECERPYLEGEEYFYSEYYDHWNVDLVYDKTLLPQKETTAKVYYKKNLAKAKKWVKKHYPKYKVRVVKCGNVPRKRKSKKVIYIEELITISDGGYNGHDVNGGYVRFSVKVKRGKIQKCYCIWNPRTNYTDDVVAFVNCHRIK